MKFKIITVAVLAALITAGSAMADLKEDLQGAITLYHSNKLAEAISLIDSALVTDTNASAYDISAANNFSAQWASSLAVKSDSPGGSTTTAAEYDDMISRLDAAADPFVSFARGNDIWLWQLVTSWTISANRSNSKGDFPTAKASAKKAIDLYYEEKGSNLVVGANISGLAQNATTAHIVSDVNLGTSATDATSYINAKKAHPQPTLLYFQKKYGANTVLQKSSLNEIFSIVTSPDVIKPMKFNEAIAARIAQECQEKVKPILRTEGKTFVGEAGRTNITEKVSPVIDLLNSPALKGIEAALLTCGVTIEPLDRTHIQTYGQQIGDMIMNGQLDPDPLKFLPHVYLALGYDLFQDWMLVYNEGGTFDWTAAQ